MVKSRPRRRRRGSAGRFPRATLEEALKIPNAFKENNCGNPWESDELRKAVGAGTGGNAYLYLTAASRDYGLTLGTSTAERISLTDLGRDIAYAPNPNAECALKVKAFLSVDNSNAFLPINETDTAGRRVNRMMWNPPESLAGAALCSSSVSRMSNSGSARANNSPFFLPGEPHSRTVRHSRPSRCRAIFARQILIDENLRRRLVRRALASSIAPILRQRKFSGKVGGRMGARHRLAPIHPCFRAWVPVPGVPEP